MVSRVLSRAVMAGGLFWSSDFLVHLQAQELVPLPDIVVTATRGPLEVARAGSAISVIKREDIERAGPDGLPDLLRMVPGLAVHESGGPGSATDVKLRGATGGQTLVMIDGIRIGDPTATDGALDFGNLSLVDIERIEVVRGAQSALYGSDAMGGVINIITRKGARAPVRSVTVEGGSYGTLHTRGSVSGATDRLTYAFSVDAFHSNGFPRFGYRITRPIVIGDGVTPLPPLPKDDPTDKGGVSGRISYRLTDEIIIDAGLTAFGNMLRFDNPFAVNPANVFDPYNHSRASLIQGFARVTADTLDGLLRNQVSVFGHMTDRQSYEREGCFDPNTFTSFDCHTGFVGTRRGGEYQGDLKLGIFGKLTFGLRSERETAQTSQSPILPGSFTPVSANQTTNSVFALHQFTLFDRLDLSLGGRIDTVEKGPSFNTWRATAAYRITETGTKLRASAGTGAKIPSLFQRFSQYGDPNLAPEQSTSLDAGIDQTFLDGRLTASATIFRNKFENLIGFHFLGCPFGNTQGCYYNVGRAETKGLELQGEAIIVPDAWRVRANYTYLRSKDLATGLELLQRPRDTAGLTVIWNGVPKLQVEGTVTQVGSRLDIDSYVTFKPVRLAPFVKLDASVNYAITDQVSVFARIINLTDARYEEAFDYGVAGRSLFAGIKVSW